MAAEIWPIHFWASPQMLTTFHEHLSILPYEFAARAISMPISSSCNHCLCTDGFIDDTVHRGARVRGQRQSVANHTNCHLSSGFVRRGLRVGDDWLRSTIVP